MKPSAEGTSCLFCEIVQKQIPSRILYEDDRAVAFQDINPQAPVHLLIIPKEHIESLAALKEEEARVVAHLFTLVPKLAEKQGLSAGGFRTVINSGESAGQTVFHLHVHLLGGRTFRWPPG